MSDTLTKKIGAADFAPEKFVKELTQQCVGGIELQQQRQKIQQLADETNVLLKKNVYHNYMQFIETAKEISHLESEMYQLSHMLTEQRSLLSSLASMSLLGDKISSVPQEAESETEAKSPQEDGEEERRRRLAAILEKVEGCMGLLETPGRTVLHEGDVLELDPVENTALQRVHAYLLSDGLMLATWIPNRRGPVRYKFQAIYELGSLAVVNVRDMGNVKMAWKLLAFPDTRVFQCSSNQSKEEWLEKFDQAKKARLAQEQQKRESANTGGVSSPVKPVRSESIDSSTNPFEDSEDSIPELELPDWLLEVPEDLDVCIAQRHFEDAYNLLERARDFLDKNSGRGSDAVIIDIRRKVETRVKALTDVLTKELTVSPDKSLQGGLRAARRAVRLLNKLSCSTQACDLFLKLCSSILKAQLKHVKREGATVLYVRQLGGIFFTNLADMAREFLRAFPNSPSCASAFVVWASSELTLFTSHLIKQVFMPQSAITSLAESVTCIRGQCDQLCELGLDLRYQLDGQLRQPLVRLLRETREKLVDAVKMRAVEDRWRPTNLQNKTGLQRFLQEMSEIGIENLESQVTGDCWVNLTSSTVAFTKLYLPLLDDCLRLSTPELQHTVDEVLGDVFQAQLKHVEASVASDKLRAERQFIHKNAVFLFDTLLKLVEQRYAEKIGHPCARLISLRDEYSWLKGEGRSRMSSTSASKPGTKYTSPEFV